MSEDLFFDHFYQEHSLVCEETAHPTPTLTTPQAAGFEEIPMEETAAVNEALGLYIRKLNASNNKNRTNFLVNPLPNINLIRYLSLILIYSIFFFLDGN